MTRTVRGEDGRVLHLGREIGRGGEATVRAIEGSTSLVKLYHRPTDLRVAKLRTMRAFRPEAARQTPVVLAWPTELVTWNREVVGFLMPRVAASTSLSIVVHPRDFRQHFPGQGLRFKLRCARNLAGVLASLHGDDVIVGDLNTANVHVARDATVALVDADSMQIRHGGHCFACAVGVRDYLAPELFDRELSRIWRDHSCDDFTLAVLIFQLLVGVHPFRAVPRSGELARDDENLARGVFAFGGYAGAHAPPRLAPRWETLHPRLRDAFFATFVAGHRAYRERTPARAWVDILRHVETELAQCGRHRAHQYWARLDACPYCNPAGARPRATPPPLPGRRGGHAHAHERPGSAHARRAPELARPAHPPAAVRPRLLALRTRGTVIVLRLRACVRALVDVPTWGPRVRARARAGFLALGRWGAPALLLAVALALLLSAIALGGAR